MSIPESLGAFEPALLWRFFLGLSAIPRGSRHEAAAADWVAEQGRALGCVVERDAVGNVLLRKAASPGREGRPTVALQGHVDMVCEKNEGTAHDFLRDPIQVVRNGDLLHARGTTLGADNGIGVAAALAVLAESTLVHPPIEVLITIDEETGLTGANGLQGGWLRAATLLNLDSEEEGELTIGCAGGVDTIARRRVTRSALPAGAAVLRIKVSGLKGGHSGIDIAQGRANALRMLAQVLDGLVSQYGVALASITGGSKRNAIPREAFATIACSAASVDAVRAQVERQETAWRAAFGAFDPNVALGVGPGETESVMSAADTRAVVGLLLAGPHGVEAMSPDIAGLVQTSTNMGVADTHPDGVEICFLTRSAIESSKWSLAARIAATAALAGFTTENTAGYPGWKPEPGAAVVGLIDAVHRELFGKPMAVKAIHAGLECGLIGEKYPQMEMASIGPNMWDVHTPDERVSIHSVGEFWKLLTAILARM